MSLRVGTRQLVVRATSPRQSGHRNALIVTRRLASTSSSQSTSRTSHALGTVALLTTGVLLTTYYLDSRSALHRYLVPNLLRLAVDPETAHLVAVKALALGVAPRDLVEDDAVLETELWGIKLSSPVGLAAGFDKHAEAMDGAPSARYFSEPCIDISQMSQDSSISASAGWKSVASRQIHNPGIHSRGSSTSPRTMLSSTDMASPPLASHSSFHGFALSSRARALPPPLPPHSKFWQST